MSKSEGPKSYHSRDTLRVTKTTISTPKCYAIIPVGSSMGGPPRAVVPLVVLLTIVK